MSLDSVKVFCLTNSNPKILRGRLFLYSTNNTFLYVHNDGESDSVSLFKVIPLLVE